MKRPAAKCLSISGKSIVFKTQDGDILEFSVDDGLKWISDNNVYVVNLMYYEDTNKPCIESSTESMLEYGKLESENTHKSDKAYLKGSVLGMVPDRFEDETYDKLLITDKNNVINRVQNITSHDLMFVGNRPLVNRTNEPVVLRAKTCIIDNPCIIPYMVPKSDADILVIAEEYILKHEFIDINTIDEINSLFHSIYGVGIKSSEHVKRSHYKTILVDWHKTNVSQQQIEERVLDIVSVNESIASKMMILYYSMCSYALLYSMYKSLDFKSSVLRAELIKLEAEIYNNETPVEFGTIGRYNTVRDAFRYNK